MRAAFNEDEEARDRQFEEEKKFESVTQLEEEEEEDGADSVPQEIGAEDYEERDAHRRYQMELSELAEQSVLSSSRVFQRGQTPGETQRDSSARKSTEAHKRLGSAKAMLLTSKNLKMGDVLKASLSVINRFKTTENDEFIRGTGTSNTHREVKRELNSSASLFDDGAPTSGRTTHRLK